MLDAEKSLDMDCGSRRVSWILMHFMLLTLSTQEPWEIGTQ